MAGKPIITGIYMIRSKVKPSKFYIGSAVNIGKRWECHKYDLNKSKHPNRRIQNHCNKYGACDLLFTVIHECDKEDLIKNEQHYIDTLKPIFNIRKKAENNLGLHWKISEEGRQNMKGRISSRKGTKTGIVPCNAFKKGEVSPFKGRHFTEESIEKLRKSHLNQFVSQETKDKKSESMLRYYKLKKAS
jgi:group I intron endonuclease